MSKIKVTRVATTRAEVLSALTFIVCQGYRINNYIPALQLFTFSSSVRGSLPIHLYVYDSESELNDSDVAIIYSPSHD